MVIHNPRASAAAVDETPVPALVLEADSRLAVIHNQRPTAHGAMPALLDQLKRIGQRAELFAIPSGSAQAQVLQAAAGFSAAVVGVGD